MTRKIIIDTDPGQDDAVAILLALASPELDVLGITVVAGNVPLSRTVLNARKILELAGRTDVPIYAGCSRPIRRPLITAEHVHGPTGLDGPSLPEPTVAIQQQHAVDFLIDSLRAAEPGEITLVTLGPLTNVALALIKAPDIAERIQEIVMIFGSFSEAGNITPAADFNNYVDPEASEVVLKSGIPLVMLPMDVTHQCLSTRERLERIRALGNRCAVATADMLTFSEHFDIEKYGWEGAPLHDPCAIAYLLKPELFAGRLVNVEVETASPLTVGMSVVDWWHVTDRPRNAQFMRTVDVPAFYELLTERLARLP
ncbi:nucleoside hydrolase [Kaistia algarum]|uniref:nucleoside hydrolase n=1 Tax=Kaistia algarum TaxID=2083279 RepID=UPI000CE828E3|nr:nucleoside hydrolase [Kaistia algarum]MCX5514365.1 nucleoside hydrolase [Kaistia algarum]PPE79113.1 nucleoside hydrolase [Kaistia algarum]